MNKNRTIVGERDANGILASNAARIILKIFAAKFLDAIAKRNRKEHPSSVS